MAAQDSSNKPAPRERENSQKKLFAKLRDIQGRLHSPKDQKSEEGWSYRSAEDILNNLKPLLQEHGLSIMFQEWPVLVGTWNYIHCSLTLYDDDGNSTIVHTAIREHAGEVDRSSAQITGSCISYAHKAALSDMFALDNSSGYDMEDPDRSKHYLYGSPKPVATAPVVSDERPGLYEGTPEWGREVARVQASRETVEQIQTRILTTYKVTRDVFERLLIQAGKMQQK